MINHRNALFIVLILLLFAGIQCKKESAEIQLLIKNETSDTLIVKKFKNDAIYVTKIPQDTAFWLAVGKYGQYIPSTLLCEQYDSITIYNVNDTITYSRIKSFQGNPFTDETVWSLNRIYEDTRCSLRCEYVTCYQYYWVIK